jgi:triphosphoribosyl-dephospho-CoA synthase
MKNRPDQRNHPDQVAQCATLAMLLELSCSPKPGNVDRCHDYSDVSFQHFLVSAMAVHPVFRKAAEGGDSVGQLLLEAVLSWRDWSLRGNTHFGSLVLMIPLALAAGRAGSLEEELPRVLKESTAQDALDFHEAFELAEVRVAEVEEFSLRDYSSRDRLLQERKTLLDLMRLSEGHDLIAKEWATSFQRCFQLASRLEEFTSEYGLNRAVVRTFLEALSAEADSLVTTKFGAEKSREVSRRAGEALEDETLEAARLLDIELLEADINPGSTADLIAASLFIALLRGLRF